MLPLSNEEKIARNLSSAIKIQDYLDTIPFNHEEEGETCCSAYGVIKRKKAHCLEGALLACYAFSLQGKPPILLSLKVTDNDYDHVIALYKENGYWGAVSKTNHSVLGFRDPVYKTIRELVMTYFHEYFLVRNGKKTLRGYSRIINLNRFGKKWITSEENLFDIAEIIYDSPHRPIIPKGNEKFIRDATRLERTTASISHDGK